MLKRAVDLAVAPSREAAQRQEALVDLAEAAWGVIANAGGGDWDRESAEWQGAAVRWRERYHALLDAQRPVKP